MLNYGESDSTLTSCDLNPMKIFNLFEEHFNTKLEKAGTMTNDFNFKKILIKNGSEIRIICKHKSMRKLFKNPSINKYFGSFQNIWELDIQTWMRQRAVLILIYGTSGSGK